MKEKISVIICAYTFERWDDMKAAVSSIQEQTVAADEIILVIDHNPELFEKSQSIPGPLIVIENQYERGLSGARNSGIEKSTGGVLFFMDEDAVAIPNWIEYLMDGYVDDNVLGVGGKINPNWVSGRPQWFPREFDWVVGCTYRGVPETKYQVRNLIGCNMSFKRKIFDEVGGFQDGIGRVGKLPVGCEETELCIRANQYWENGQFVYDPRAQVHHRVPADRGNWKYFRSRCYFEGISKALVAQKAGAKDGLSTERTYTMKTLPTGILAGIGDAFKGDFSGLGRSFAIVLGLFMTTWGYTYGKIKLA